MATASSVDEKLSVRFVGLVDTDKSYGVKLGERYAGIKGFGEMFKKPDVTHELNVSGIGLTKTDLVAYLKHVQETGYVPEVCPFSVIRLAFLLGDSEFVQNYGDRTNVDAITDLTGTSKREKAFVLDLLINKIKNVKGFKIVSRRQRPNWWYLLALDPVFGETALRQILRGQPITDQTIAKRWRACISAFADHPLAPSLWTDQFREVIADEFHISAKRKNGCLKNETIDDLKKWIARQVDQVSATTPEEKEVQAEAQRLYDQHLAKLGKFTKVSYLDAASAESVKDIQHDTIWAQCLQTAKSKCAKRRNEKAKQLDYTYE